MSQRIFIGEENMGFKWQVQRSDQRPKNHDMQSKYSYWVLCLAIFSDFLCHFLGKESEYFVCEINWAAEELIGNWNLKSVCAVMRKLSWVWRPSCEKNLVSEWEQRLIRVRREEHMALERWVRNEDTCREDLESHERCASHTCPVMVAKSLLSRSSASQCEMAAFAFLLPRDLEATNCHRCFLLGMFFFFGCIAICNNIFFSSSVFATCCFYMEFFNPCHSLDN